MTPPNALTVWLRGIPVATIDLGLHPRRNRLRLSYRQEALDTFDLGTPLLSINLPLRTDPYPNAQVRAFTDGLLPEQTVRLAVAAELQLRADDTYGLIAALGRDCAGALIVQPADDPAPKAGTTATAQLLSEAEIESLVANLRSAPLGVSDQVRLSLGGVQEKLLLTQMSGQGWGSPVDGTPSTHIFKPELREYPHMVANEAFCMRLAALVGLETAKIETTRVGDRPVLVVTRFDRLIHDNGRVERIHQEDFCQSLGLSPTNKYQSDGGPSLSQIAGILTNFDPDSVDTLLRAVTLNVIIGNADAHGKNFSLMHEPSGEIRLAPLYDLISTQYYKLTSQMSMLIDTVQRIDRVTDARIVNEAVSWGMSRQRADDTVHEVLHRMPDAIKSATEQTTDVPRDLLDLINAQLHRVGS